MEAIKEKLIVQYVDRLNKLTKNHGVKFDYGYSFYEGQFVCEIYGDFSLSTMEVEIEEVKATCEIESLMSNYGDMHENLNIMAIEDDNCILIVCILEPEEDKGF